MAKCGAVVGSSHELILSDRTGKEIHPFVERVDRGVYEHTGMRSDAVWTMVPGGPYVSVNGSVLDVERLSGNTPKAQCGDNVPSFMVGGPRQVHMSELAGTSPFHRFAEKCLVNFDFVGHGTRFY